jgi:hypothetical protein
VALVICDVLTRTFTARHPEPAAPAPLGDDCPFALTDREVRRLMRVHRWTIRTLAGRLGVTRARVRHVRLLGVTGHAACDWYQALTGALSPAMTAWYRGRMEDSR